MIVPEDEPHVNARRRSRLPFKTPSSAKSVTQQQSICLLDRQAEERVVVDDDKDDNWFDTSSSSSLSITVTCDPWGEPLLQQHKKEEKDESDFKKAKTLLYDLGMEISKLGQRRESFQRQIDSGLDMTRGFWQNDTRDASLTRMILSMAHIVGVRAQLVEMQRQVTEQVLPFLMQAQDEHKEEGEGEERQMESPYCPINIDNVRQRMEDTLEKVQEMSNFFLPDQEAIVMLQSFLA